MYKLINIQRGEPDSLLFEIPADYTIRDDTQDLGGKNRYQHETQLSRQLVF